MLCFINSSKVQINNNNLKKKISNFNDLPRYGSHNFKMIWYFQVLHDHVDPLSFIVCISVFSTAACSPRWQYDECVVESGSFKHLGHTINTDDLLKGFSQWQIEKMQQCPLLDNLGYYIQRKKTKDEGQTKFYIFYSYVCGGLNNTL